MLENDGQLLSDPQPVRSPEMLSRQPLLPAPRKQRTMILLVLLVILLFLSGGGYYLGQKLMSPSSPEEDSETIDLQNLPDSCRLERTCGSLIGVDCGSAADGPYYYVDKATEKIIEYCGGSCMGGPRGKYCRNCPPKEWTCSTY